MKIGARAIEHIACIRIQLPTSYRQMSRTVAFGLAPSSA